MDTNYPLTSSLMVMDTNYPLTSSLMVMDTNYPCTSSLMVMDTNYPCTSSLMVMDTNYPLTSSLNKCHGHHHEFVYHLRDVHVSVAYRHVSFCSNYTLHPLCKRLFPIRWQDLSRINLSLETPTFLWDFVMSNISF
jgi:hypothetical protein